MFKFNKSLYFFIPTDDNREFKNVLKLSPTVYSFISVSKMYIFLPSFGIKKINNYLLLLLSSTPKVDNMEYMNFVKVKHQ